MRLFTAIEIPEDVKDEVVSLYSGSKNVKWITKENLHITLNFLGDLENWEVDTVQSVLSKIEVNSFTISLSGAGYFKSGALWLGVNKNDHLTSLERVCSRELLKAGIGLDVRKFKPHLTVGRFKKKDIYEFLDSAMGYKSRKFEIKGFNLYSSILKPTGAIYTKLASY